MWNLQEAQTDPVQCPVCKSLLGRRAKGQIFISHCEECRATFIWKTKTGKPSVELDKNKPKGCGCGRCGR